MKSTFDPIKKGLSLLLAIVMLTAMLPLAGIVPALAATEAEIDEQQKAEFFATLGQLGLVASPDDKPEDYRVNDNPSSGKYLNLSKVPELYMYYSEKDNNTKRNFYDNTPGPTAWQDRPVTTTLNSSKAIPTKAVPINADKNAGADQKFTAELSAVNIREFQVNIRSVSTDSTSGNYSTTFDVGNWTFMKNRQYEQLFDHYFQIVSGDFNGDGCDDIAFYVPTIWERETNTVSWEIWVVYLQKSGSNVVQLGSTLKITGSNSGFANSRDGWLTTPTINLSVANLNRDRFDDLVVVQGWTRPQDGPQGGKDGASTLYIYDNLSAASASATSKPSFTKKLEETGLTFEDTIYRRMLWGDYDETTLKATVSTIDVRKPHTTALTAVSTAAGSVVSAESNDLVIAGYSIVKKADGSYSDSYIPFTLLGNSNLSNVDYYQPYVGISVLQYDQNRKDYVFIDENGYDTDEFTYTRIDEMYETVQSVFAIKGLPAPLSLSVAKLKGSENRSYIIADGFVYLMDSSGGSVSYESYSLHRVRMNGEFYADRLHSKGTLSQSTWIKQTAAANINGDAMGRERVYAIVNYDFYGMGMQYLYELTAWDMSDGKLGGIGCGHWKKNVAPMGDNLAWGSWSSLCVQDVDSKDGMIAEFKGRIFTYTEPKVLAVLAAAPYFSDLAEADPRYGGDGYTAIRDSRTEGDSHEANIGTYISVWGVVAASGAVVAYFEAKAGITASLDYTFTKGWSQTKSVTRTNDTPYDQVLVATVPVDILYYEITTADGEKDIMSVTCPYTARETMIPVSEYDKIAEKSPDLPVIRGNILKHTEGDPSTYTYARPSDVTIGGVIKNAKFPDSHHIATEWAWNKTNSTLSLEVTKDDSHTIALDVAIFMGIQGGFLVGAGFEAGFHAGYGFTHFNSSGTEFTGYVSDISKSGEYGNAFDFEWGVRDFEVYTESGGKKMNFKVLTYETRNVTRPMRPPTNLTQDDDGTTTDTIRLEWTRSVSGFATQELQYRMQGNTAWTTVDNSISASESSYEHIGLSAGRIYEYRLRALDGPTNASLYTPVLEAQTKVASMPSFDTDVTDCSLREGEQALFSVKVIPGRNGQIDYQWQEFINGVWVNIPNTNRNYYSVQPTTKFDENRQFRCVVTETDMGVSAKITSKSGKIEIVKHDTAVALVLSSDNGAATYEPGGITGDEIDLTATVTSGTYTAGNKSGLITFVIELPVAAGAESQFITLNGEGNTVGDEYIATAKFTASSYGDHKITAIYSGNVDFKPAQSGEETYRADYPAGMKMLVLTDSEGNEYTDRLSRNVVYGESVRFEVAFAEVQSDGTLDKTPLSIDNGDFQYDSGNFSAEDDGEYTKFTCVSCAGAMVSPIIYNDGADDYYFNLNLSFMERSVAVIPDNISVDIGDPLPGLTFMLESEHDGWGVLDRDYDAVFTEIQTLLACETFDSNQRGSYPIAFDSNIAVLSSNYAYQLAPASVKVKGEGVNVDFSVEGSDDSLIIGKAFNKGVYEDQFVSGDKVEKGLELEFSLEFDDPDKHVEHWILNNKIVPATKDLTVFDLEGYTDDIDLVAVLADTRYVVDYSTSTDDGTIQGYYSGTQAFDSGVSLFGGTYLRFVATPYNGFVVKEWRIDGMPVAGNMSNELTVSGLSKDIVVLVVFESAATYSVTFGVKEGNGEVTAQSEDSYLESGDFVTVGTIVTFTADPAPGQLFRRWYVDGVAGVNTVTYPITVTADTDIKAAFASIQNYTVTYDAEQFGGADIGTVGAMVSASPVLSGTSVGGGNNVVFTATLESGYETTHKLSHWLVNGETVKNDGTNSYTHYLNDDLDVTAIFSLITQHTVTFDADGGTPLPSALTEVVWGSVITKPATDPTKTGYTFDGWYTKENGDFDTEWDFASDKVIEDFILYARWTANTLVFGDQTLTSGTVGTEYTANVTAATNGSGNYTYAAPTLEADVPGLEMLPDGTISGMPELAVTAKEFTVIVYDTVTAATQEATYTITIAYAPTYTLTVTAPVFGVVIYGYNVRPAAKNISIVSSGNTNAAIESVDISGTAFEISGGGDTVASGRSIDTWTVQPVLGLSADTYTETITVTYDNGATAIANVSFTVNKATQDPPDAPMLASKTTSSITLTVIKANENGAAAEYSRDGGNWQDSPTFTGLSSGADYMFTARYKTVPNFNASPNSEPANFTTSTGGGSGVGGGGSGITSYTVTFDSNGGSAVQSQSVTSGGKAVKPTDPSKEGFAFAGWYLDKETTTEYDFSKLITGNITLYAKWVQNEQTQIPNEKPKFPFIDVYESDWFYGDVYYVWENNLFNGTSATTFSPDEPMTRAMLVTVLWRMEGSPEAASTPLAPFTDVDSNSYYYQAVLWAAQNGIVNGIGGGLFAPDAEITRQDLAVMLMRYIGFIKYEYIVNDDYRIFADENEIADYAKNAIQTLNKLGIINGKGNSVIDSQGTATRAEVAAMLHRLLELVK